MKWEFQEDILRKCFKTEKAEYISADLGARGGYRLNKTLKDITLGDVIRLMEKHDKNKPMSGG